MQRHNVRAAALGAILLAALTSTLTADIKDYEFQLVTKVFKEGEAKVAVKHNDVPLLGIVPNMLASIPRQSQWNATRSQLRMKSSQVQWSA